MNDDVIFELQGAISDLERENDKLHRQLKNLRDGLRKVEEKHMEIRFNWRSGNWEVVDERGVLSSKRRLLDIIDGL